jgi:hypothetical protein
MVNSSRPPAEGLDDIEKGCSFIANGELRSVSQENCPGWKVKPRWPTGSTATVHESPRSF